jgi:hypothetical protein
MSLDIAQLGLGVSLQRFQQPNRSDLQNGLIENLLEPRRRFRGIYQKRDFTAFGEHFERRMATTPNHRAGLVQKN